MDPRQMSMMMKKLGIDVRDIEGVQSVTIRTATKDYVFDKASVSVMRAQGTETWQVSGKPRTVDRTAAATAAPSGAAGPASNPPAPAMPADVEAPLVISKEDVDLVAKETGRSPAEARAALEATKGDLAEAIVRLQG